MMMRMITSRAGLQCLRPSLELVKNSAGLLRNRNDVPILGSVAASSSSLLAFQRRFASTTTTTSGKQADSRTTLSSTALIEMEDRYGAHNYHPIPCVFHKAQGVYVWDPEGRRYYDFLSAYSAVNQGHCHPKIISALVEQSQKLTLSSRAFYNDIFPRYAKYITEYFGYHKVLPMNSGAEAVETALKLARKWAYIKKKVSLDEAVIVSCTSCFHGRTLGIISMSDDESARHQFGPYLPGLDRVEYGNLQSLEALFKARHDKIAGFLIEPIQGEAGVVVPTEGYLRAAADLCKKYNILFIADEIQSGLGRTGKLLACDWENVHPDILILGKALSGGALPVSAVLADDEIMLCIKPGEHGSTFGGNPLASAVGIAALEVLKEEKLTENAERQGKRIREFLKGLKMPFVTEIRGKGLLNAIVIDPNFKKTAWDICMSLKERGLLCKPTHDHIIRLAPPLIINDQQVDECLKIIRETLEEYKKF